MKKIYKRPLFWMLMLAILIILLNYFGQDGKNIIIIGLNPILSILSRLDGIREFMNSGYSVKTLYDSISIYWYFGCLMTMVIYGLLIELIIMVIKSIRK